MGSKQQLTRVQKALAKRGFDPGPIDGAWGRLTERAVRRFQSAAGLVIDGIVGARTLAALIGETPLPDINNIALPWFQEARRLLGLREGPGSSNNPVIIDWAKKNGIAYGNDETPWCGLFIAHCIAATLPHESLPADPLGAQKWRKFGTFVTPQLGAIMVFWREKETSWKGHVGLYAGEDETAFHILGGNQSDSVSIARIERRRFLEARWPASIPIGVGSAMIVQEGAGLSTNEA